MGEEGRRRTDGMAWRKWIYIQRWMQHDMGTGVVGYLSLDCGLTVRVLPCRKVMGGSGTVPLPGHDGWSSTSPGSGDEKRS